MNKSILNAEVQKYINDHLKGDLTQMLLRKSPFSDVSIAEIVQQIKGKNTAEKKFPFLCESGIVFPPQLNLEQASSQSTGQYKSHLVVGKSLVDLTCGFGIDAFWLSQEMETVFLIERNSELLEIVAHNWSILGRNANFCNQTLEEFLTQNPQNFDCIYLDPARRDEQKKKVFLLEDLSPNILEIQEQLLQRALRVVVKLSPLIDIAYLASNLSHLKEIHVVAVKNEVKEILVVLEVDNSMSSPQIIVANLETDDPICSFSLDALSSAVSTYSEPQKYLYIPNNALLKSGAFHWISHHYQLGKLHPNTHLYTSDFWIDNFPGRAMEVEVVDAKSLKKNEQYNIISKNHPLKPEEIKKKYQLKDGGEQYLIFTQSRKGKLVLKSKIQNN